MNMACLFLNMVIAYGMAPLGIFERTGLADGTIALAQAFANVQHGFGLLGGGDTNTAIKPVMTADTAHSFILAGGGAPMSFLARAGELESINAMRYEPAEFASLFYGN